MTSWRDAGSFTNDYSIAQHTPSKPVTYDFAVTDDPTLTDKLTLTVNLTVDPPKHMRGKLERRWTLTPFFDTKAVNNHDLVDARVYLLSGLGSLAAEANPRGLDLTVWGVCPPSSRDKKKDNLYLSYARHKFYVDAMKVAEQFTLKYPNMRIYIRRDPRAPEAQDSFKVFKEYERKFPARSISRVSFGGVTSFA